MTTPRDPNTPRNPDQLIDAFLDEGPMDLRDQVLDEVRTEVDRTEQRTTFGPWRNLMATRFVGLAAVGAVVILAVVVGISLGGSPLIGGAPSLSPSAQPSGAPSSAAPSEAPASVEPSGSGDISLPVGLHVMNPVDISVIGDDSVTVTIPAPGWFAEPDGASVTKDLGVFGRVTVVAVAADYYRVPRNICNWQNSPGSGPESRMAETVDELVAFIREQTWDTAGTLTREFLPTIDSTIDGYPGKLILDDAPAYPGSDPSGCDEQRFCTLLDRDGGQCLLSHSEPGALDTIWIADPAFGIAEPFGMSNFDRVVASSGWPNVEFRPEMGSLVESMTFTTD